MSGRDSNPVRSALVSRDWPIPLLVFGVSLVPLIAMAWVWSDRELGQDAPEYLAIAQSLAEGNGYKDTHGYWPDARTCGRMPVWPAIVALGLWIAPAGAPNEMVLRWTASLCLALVGACFAVLCRQLGVRSRSLCFLSGFAVALSPPLVFIAVSGMSEISFLLLVVLGLSCLLAGGRWGYASALAFGLAALVRTNFAVFPIFWAILALVSARGRRWMTERYSMPTLVVFFVLTLVPTMLWAIRNYSVTGRFPLLSTIEGEALWGANNPVTANDLEYWGSWILPDDIPGETKMADLAVTRTEVEVGEHYHDKAVQWVWSHPRELPRLLLGKLIRAFVPVPWVPLAASFAAFGYRLLLDVLFVATLSWWWRPLDRLYLLFLAAMLAVVLPTTLVFYGNYRFTHCTLEVFFVPCIALGVSRWIEGRKTASGVSKPIQQP